MDAAAVANEVSWLEEPSAMKVLSTPKEILERFAERVTLMPGLSEGEVAHFSKQLEGHLPDDVEELLNYSAGFDFQLGLPRTPVGTVRFTGTGSFGFPSDALPYPIDLLGDGFGNFWVVDVDKATGKWGSVFYACHDPAVIVMQAQDLCMFLSQVLAPNETNPKNALHHIRKEVVPRIWKDDPWLVSVHDARRSLDPVVSKFAAQLPENFRLADLRSREVGCGFSWGKAGPNAEVRRDGPELLFAVEQRVPKAPGFFKRILKRTS